MSAHFEAGPVRELIHQLKYDRTVELVPILGKILMRSLSGRELTSYILVPVPLHTARMNERGFNQAELLAVEVGRAIGLPVVLGLRRVRNTISQTGLERHQRLANVAGAFAVAENVEGKNIILIDDVITTGATMNECAVVLKRAGANRIWGVAVARG